MDKEGISNLEKKEQDYKKLDKFDHIKIKILYMYKTKLMKHNKTRQLIIFPFKELKLTKKKQRAKDKNSSENI